MHNRKEKKYLCVKRKSKTTNISKTPHRKLKISATRTLPPKIKKTHKKTDASKGAKNPPKKHVSSGAPEV